MSSANRSPWPSHTFPSAIRSVNRAARPSRYRRTLAVTAPATSGSSTGPTNGSIVAKLDSQRARTASTVAVAEISGDRSARAWNAARTRAIARRHGPTSPPASTMVASRRSSGIRRMTTTCSEGVPSGPSTSATPRYTSGARRRFSATSRSHCSRRSSGVDRSTKSNTHRLLDLVRAVAQEEHGRHVRLAHCGGEHRWDLYPGEARSWAASSAVGSCADRYWMNSNTTPP